jgi:hypothetical protein
MSDLEQCGHGQQLTRSLSTKQLKEVREALSKQKS